MAIRRTSGCLPSFFPKILSGVDLDGQRSEEIDRQLARDKLTYRKTHQIFFMGGNGSGKSTIFVKLRQVHGEKFAGNIKTQADLIRKYVVHLMVHILTEMKTMSPPIRLSSLKNEAIARIILDIVKKPNFKNFDEFSNYSNIPNFVNFPNLISVLWQDPALVQATEDLLCYKAPHFFNRIDEICKESYIPSSEDNLLCSFSSSVNIDDFFVEGAISNFRFIDINNKMTRVAWRRWVNYLEPTQLLVVFVVDCSAYDIIRYNETPVYTELHDSLCSLEHLLSGRWFEDSFFLIVLNKYDVFKNKILSGSKLEDYFPKYKTFTSLLKKSNNDCIEVLRATYFIRNEIKKISEAIDSRAPNFCLPYQICANNEDDIKLLLSDLRKHCHEI